MNKNIIIDEAVVGWCDFLETGLPEVDLEHKMFFDIIDEVFEAAKVGYKEFETILQTVLSHVAWHFKNEEDYMKSKKLYPKYIENHRLIHTQCMTQLAKMRDTVLRKNSEDNIIYQKELAINITHFIKNWLIFHILSEDYKIAKQMKFIEDGNTPEEAFHLLKDRIDKNIDTLAITLINLLKIYELRHDKLLEIEADIKTSLEKKEKQLQDIIQENRKRSITDELTGIYNRRQAMSVLNDIWKEHSEPMCSIIQIDLDNFKEVNDTFGHHAGDLVLKQFANTVKECIRTNELCNKYKYGDEEIVHFFRLGGDEFLIILHNFNLEESVAIAGDIHASINAIKVVDEQDKLLWRGSASMGVACRNADNQDYESVLKKADKYLYKAKEDGKNCIRSKLHDIAKKMDMGGG